MHLHLLVNYDEKVFLVQLSYPSLENLTHSLSWPCMTEVALDGERRNIKQEVKLQLKSKYM